MAATVVVVGSCMTDLIGYVSCLPKAGETVHGKTFNIGFGGKGANQAVMSAKLGTKTVLFAKLGTDAFGDNYIKHLRCVGVDITHVKKVEGASGVAMITVDDNAENCITIIGGANNFLSEHDISIGRYVLAVCRVIVLQMEVPLATNLAALKISKEVNKDITTIFNAAPATDSLPSELYRLVDIFCVNESEAEKLLGISSVKTVEDAGHAAGLLVGKGCRIGMITLGANGVVYQEGTLGDFVHVSCPKVKAVDTTGAGDAFIGSLASLLANEDFEASFKKKVEIACNVASNSVTKLGTQASYPTSYEC